MNDVTNIDSRVGKYLTLRETFKSDTAIRCGIDNTPDEATIIAIRATVAAIFDPLCDSFGGRLRFNSFFRCKRLNTKISGSSKTSQHTKGEAIDIDEDGSRVTNIQIMKRIIDLNLPFDQVIHEFGTDNNPDWVHVSHKSTGENRKQILRSMKDRDGNVYYIDITKKFIA